MSDSSVASSASLKRLRPRGDREEGDDDDELHDRKRSTTRVTTKELMAGISSISASISTLTTTLGQHGEMLSQHGELLSTLPALNEKLNSYCQEMAEIKRSVTEVEHTVADLRKENAELKTSLSALTTRVDALTVLEPVMRNADPSELQKLATVVSSHTSSLRFIQQQQTVPDELVISGFPDGKNLTEALPLVQSTLKALQVTYSPSDISTARFMRKTASNKTQHRNQVPPAATPLSTHAAPGPQTSAATLSTRTRVSIAVKCSNPLLIRAAISAKKKLGNLKYAMLDKTMLDSSSTPPTNVNSDFLIQVNELLPSRVYSLLGKAKACLKPAGFKYVWAKNMTVYAKFSEADLIHPVHSVVDVEKLISLYASDQQQP